MFLISSITTAASKIVTDSIRSGWDATWNTAFDGAIFKILASLGTTLAVCTLLVWTIFFFNNLANDRTYRNLQESGDRGKILRTK